MPKQPSQELEELTHAYLSAFTSDAGVKVLDDLNAAYSGSAIAPKDPYATHYNVGAQDVIKYIMSMINLAKEKHNAD